MATFRRKATYRQSFLPDIIQEIEERAKKDEPFDYHVSTDFKCSGFDKTGQYHTMLQKDPEPAVDTYDGPYFVEPETDELNSRKADPILKRKKTSNSLLLVWRGCT